MLGTEGIACETETCILDAKSISERLRKTVEILERYVQTGGVAGNLLDMSNLEAAKASAPSTRIEKKNRPLLAGNSVRLWQGEALSHFRNSSWEGELLVTLVIEFPSCHRVSCITQLNRGHVVFLCYDQRCCLRLR